MSNEVVANGPIPKQSLVFTVALTIACAVALGSSCPWGFFQENRAQSVAVLIFFGLAASIIVSLAAWAMLRDSDPFHRYALPIVLLTILLSTSWFGTWHNSNDYTSRSVKDIALIFIAASLFFYVARTLVGWRLGPSFAGDRRLRLSHIFLWTAVAGFVFAVLGWFRPSLDEFMYSTSDIPKVLSMLLISFGACWLGFAGIGVALEGVRRMRNWVVCFVGVLLIIGPMIKFHIENGFPNGFVLDEWLLLLLPTVMFVFPWWCFRVYRSFGYSLVSQPISTTDRDPFTWRIVAAIGCVLLVTFAYGANAAFAKQRGNKAIVAKWKPLGIAAFSSDGKAFDQVYFDANRPLTEETLAKLEGQKLKSVTIWGHVPELGSLGKLVISESVERVFLRGGTITRRQLEELYEAKHLKQVYVECKAPLIVEDIEKLRSALPDCEIIKE